MEVKKPFQSDLVKILNYFENGNHQEAEKLAIITTEQFPNHPFSWKILGIIFSQTGRLSKSLEAKQMGFCSLNESIDTTTAGGKLIFHIFGSLSEFERSIIKERTKAGLEAARKQGRVGGRKPKLKAEDVESIKTLLANPKFSVKDIAERHNISVATLYRYVPHAKNVT